MTGTQALWFLSRASGLVLLVALSAAVVLGIATKMAAAPRWFPRFAVSEMHRVLSIFSLVLLALHVLTALLDPYVSIGWWATLVPFVSRYRPFALGLGTLALDLVGALVLSSLARRRLGWRSWRAVHWAAYAVWPIALVHGLQTGTDWHQWWVADIGWGCAAAVATGLGARLLAEVRTRSRREPSRRVPTATPRPGARL
jgi:sulfoxide reductase heme-binding subunit YedZ